VTKNNTCDRCGAYVERKKIRQWVLRITDYAERLLADIDTLDWPEGIKEMQRNWIGKSEGCEFRMQKDIRKKNEDGYRTDAGGCTKDNTATTSFLIDSIYKSGTKVKKKDKNVHFSDIDVYTKTQK
jgi:leucyl-tRNA synthetase